MDAAFTESKVIGQAGKVEEGAVAGAESQSQKLLTWDKAEQKQITYSGEKDQWMPNTSIVSRPAPPNYRGNMVVGENQQNFGGWISTDNIPNMSYVRNDLSITKEFKPSDNLYVQQVEINEGVMIQEGIVGAQEYNDVKSLGGGNQTRVLVEEKERNNVMKKIGDKIKIEK